jgi:hypothetical protein
VLGVGWIWKFFGVLNTTTTVLEADEVTRCSRQTMIMGSIAKLESRIQPIWNIIPEILDPVTIWVGETERE